MRKKIYTIAVVDDEATIGDLITAILEEEGFQVVCFDSTTLAWNELTHHTISVDLILLDLVMPNEDGVTFRRRLQGDSKLSRVPVILMSALAHDRVTTLNDFNDPILYKPFDINVLLESVAAHCKAH